MKEKKVIGIMSGTSIDEVDACLALIKPDFSFEIIDTISIDFKEKTQKKILNLANNLGTVKDVCKMNFKLGKLFAKTANELMKKSGQKADIISSHGQTIWHKPSKSTLQLGDISVITQNTGVLTIGDFRPADIAKGGEGAPLVCFADEIIFGRDTARAIQNIGGIGNVTVINPQNETFAFDTGPGNMLMDYFAQALFDKKYDYQGQLAAQGEINETWLNQLLQEDFYKKAPPKTTGRELFSDEYAQKILNNAPENHYDIMATITALTAKTIQIAYENFVLPRAKIKEVIIGGGGAYNKYLINLIEDYTKLPIKTHEDYNIPNKYKEALAFAILGYATYNKIPNNLPSCTGAKSPVVMGKIAYPS